MPLGVFGVLHFDACYRYPTDLLEKHGFERSRESVDVSRSLADFETPLGAIQAERQLGDKGVGFDGCYGAYRRRSLASINEHVCEAWVRHKRHDVEQNGDPQERMLAVLDNEGVTFTQAQRRFAMSMQYTLPLSDPQAELVVVGGKGASLARMVRSGLPVPDGFHVTTAAYRAFVDEHALQPRISEALQTADANQPATLGAASAQIGTLFAEGRVPADVAVAVEAAYAALATGDEPVAVRSSATAEDLPDASFAGQQETFLNVRGVEAVLDAVKRCWASLWTARAIGYRMQHAIDQEIVSLDDLVAERKMQWRGRRRATPPQILPEDSFLKRFERFMPAVSTDQTGAVIKGIAVGEGKVTAKARVLQGPEDFGTLQPGEVLVTGITTPAWTPLFALASAIVTDIGGPLSHSSIVAREYGIPAVLGTGVATKRIRSGQTIRVDGDAGTVTLLDEAGAELPE